MKKDANQQLLAAQFDEKMKQVENDFANLMLRVSSIGPSSGLKVTQDFGIDFSQKIINTLETIATEFPSFVEHWNGLPTFIKQEDVMTLIERIPPLGLRLAHAEPWMKRLAYANGDTITKAYTDFKEKIKQSNKIYTTESDKEELLTSFERFENGTLAVRSVYEKQLRRVEKAHQALVQYRDNNQERSGLTGERASALTGILTAYSRIPLQLEEAELKRFKRTEAYQKAQETDEHLSLSQRHMKHYQECPPLEKQIELLNEVLTSQRNLDDDTNKYSVLFKHHPHPKGLWKKITQVDSSPILKLTALRDALVTAEEARKAFIKADSELSEPLLGDQAYISQQHRRSSHETARDQLASSAEKEVTGSSIQDNLDSPKTNPVSLVRKMATDYEQMLTKRSIFKEKKQHKEDESEARKNKP